mmetsp:Transcript_17930/g.34014  ORF Transcript_17930/g.34014 Transcript_17930/m.34014 type:complete len:273 (-) Transcript_17930:268-1086(-)
MSVFNARKAYVAKTVDELNSLFVDRKSNKAVYARFVFAGPGPLKNDVVEHPKLRKEIKSAVIGVHDVAYPFENGLSEAVRLSRGAMSNIAHARGQALIKKLFTRIAKDNKKYSIGARDTFEGMREGAAMTLLVTEDAPYQTIVCEPTIAPKDSKEEDPDQGTHLVFHHAVSEKDLAGKLKEIEQDNTVVVREVVQFVDWALDHAERLHKCNVEVIAVRSPEGLQFKAGFGGIAALTRYEFHPSSEDTEFVDLEDSDESSSKEDDDDTGDIFG